MPRRRPAQLRADACRRLLRIRSREYPGTIQISNLPGLSPHGRMALAGLERTRLWPGAAEEAWRIWEGFVRSPYHRIYDYRYDKGCGHCRSRDFEHLLVTVNRK
jgi:hypothetical protein